MRGSNGTLLLAGLSLAVTTLTCRAEAQIIDFCRNVSPDVGYYVHDDFWEYPSRVDRPSEEAIYYYSVDYGGRLCNFWIMDIWVNVASNLCDPPSTYSCGVYIGDQGWDVPSSLKTINQPWGWWLPAREQDCNTYLRHGRYYKQPAGGSLTREAVWTVTGSWYGSLCTLTSNGPHEFFAISTTTEAQWDRHRIVSRLAVRGSGQQTEVYIREGNPP